jgi:uncharacterized protein (TIGR00730 family)
MRVTVFGGAAPRPGEPAYDEALRLGRLLGEQGCTVLTGAYLGTMEAVSRGANEAGGHVIGVSCEAIEQWRPIRANAWVQEEWLTPTLKERLFTLIEQCDAAITLPGGPGTLAEFAVMWNLLIIAALPPRPLILVGPGWRETVEVLCRTHTAYIPSHQQEFLSFATTVEEAVEMLQMSKLTNQQSEFNHQK